MRMVWGRSRMWMAYSVVLLSLLASATAAESLLSSCPLEAKERFMKCRLRTEGRVKTRQDILRMYCGIIEDILTDCFPIFKTCLTPNMMQLQKEQYLNEEFHSAQISVDLIAQLTKCTPMAEYLASGRYRPLEAGNDLCSAQELEENRHARISCIVEEMSKIRAARTLNRSAIKMQMCQSLSSIIDGRCADKLNKCHPLDRLVDPEYRLNLLNIIKKITSLDTINVKIDDCPVFQEYPLPLNQQAAMIQQRLAEPFSPAALQAVGGLNSNVRSFDRGQPISLPLSSGFDTQLGYLLRNSAGSLDKKATWATVLMVSIPYALILRMF